jgi:hypothetical protein
MPRLGRPSLQNLRPVAMRPSFFVPGEGAGKGKEGTKPRPDLPVNGCFYALKPIAALPQLA